METEKTLPEICGLIQDGLTREWRKQLNVDPLEDGTFGVDIEISGIDSKDFEQLELFRKLYDLPVITIDAVREGELSIQLSNPGK